MALVNIRIGSAVDVHTYDDAAYSSAIETLAPIKSGTPVDPTDVLRLEDLTDIFLTLIDSIVSFENEVVCFNGNVVTG